MSYGLNDCILAISTPFGQSLRAIIRLSGKDVFSCLRGLFAPDNIREIVREKGFRSYRSNIYLKRNRFAFLPLFMS